MASAGIGSPLAFACSKCRRGRGRTLRGEAKPRSDTELTMVLLSTILLTGKIRAARFRLELGWRPGKRSEQWERQYKCTACGHIGWSNHVDLQRLHSLMYAGMQAREAV